MRLSPEGKADITWWINNIMFSFSPILRENPSMVMTTDASLKGWGACCNGVKTGGLFSDYEMDHINVLETKAVYFGLQALCSDINNRHIKVLIDNSATVGAINNMGSSKSSILNGQIKMIWEWILAGKNWLSASHIPGILNVEADAESRKNDSKIEWKLNKKTFDFVVKHLKFEPCFDLFASRINTQLPRFAAYRPDPEAEVIDAFSISWKEVKFYAFVCIGFYKK